MLSSQARMLISLVFIKILIRNNRNSASEGTRGSVTCIQTYNYSDI